jgi:hypothetical protein
MLCQITPGEMESNFMRWIPDVRKWPEWIGPVVKVICVGAVMMVVGKIVEETHSERFGSFPEWVGHVLREVGLALTFGGPIGVFYEKAARKHVMHEIRHELTRLVDSLSASAADIRATGFRAYHPLRDKTNYVKLLNDAQESFFALGITLSDLLGDVHFMELAFRALLGRPKLQIRFLVLSPCCVAFAHKTWRGPYSSKHHTLIEKISTGIRCIRYHIDKIRKDPSLSPEQVQTILGRIEVRAYSALPATSSVFNENAVDVSIYEEIEQAVTAPAFIFDRRCLSPTGTPEHGKVYERLCRNFEALWNSPTTIDLLDKKDKLLPGINKHKDELKELEELAQRAYNEMKKTIVD